MTLRIILADDYQIVRQGLRTLLEQQSHIQVVAETENGRETVEKVRELLPDIVIMDVAMPELNGIEATRQITAEFPGVKIIALSMHSERRLLVEMLKAGAAGYLLKDCAFEELAWAIRTVMENQIYLSPNTANIILSDYLKRLSPNDTSAFSLLTAREREVLQLLAEGKTAKQIAASLHLSVKTIESHRLKIMTRLKVDSIAELTKYAIREGLTALEG